MGAVGRSPRARVCHQCRVVLNARRHGSGRQRGDWYLACLSVKCSTPEGMGAVGRLTQSMLDLLADKCSTPEGMGAVGRQAEDAAAFNPRVLNARRHGSGRQPGTAPATPSGPCCAQRPKAWERSADPTRFPRLFFSTCRLVFTNVPARRGCASSQRASVPSIRSTFNGLPAFKVGFGCQRTASRQDDGRNAQGLRLPPSPAWQA